MDLKGGAPHIKLGEQVGFGPISRSFKAHDAVSNSEVSVHMYPIEKLKNTPNVDTLKQDFDILKALKHPNVLPIRNIVIDNTFLYVIHDLHPECDLNNYISNHPRMEERLCSHIFRQIVEAVYYCHERGVYHGDLQPSNIIFTGFPRTKVMNFGILRHVNDISLMNSNTEYIGFAAPEILDDTVIDHSLCDLWSLGVLLHVMATGSLPWSTDNLALLTKKVIKGEYTPSQHTSIECHHLISSLLKVDPHERMNLENILSHPFLIISSRLPMSIPLQRHATNSSSQDVITLGPRVVLRPLRNPADPHQLLNSMNESQTPSELRLMPIGLRTRNMFLTPQPQRGADRNNSILNDIAIKSRRRVVSLKTPCPLPAKPLPSIQK